MLENVGNCHMATVPSVYPSMLFWMWNLLILRNLNYDPSAYWKIHANAEGCQTFRTHWSLDPHYQMWVMGKGVEKLMSIWAKYKSCERKRFTWWCQDEDTRIFILLLDQLRFDLPFNLHRFRFIRKKENLIYLVSKRFSYMKEKKNSDQNFGHSKLRHSLRLSKIS